MLEDIVKKKIRFMSSVQNLSNSEIARKLKVSRNTVIKVLKEKSTVDTQLLNSVKEIEQKNNESLLNMLREDDRLASITGKILDHFDNDIELKNEIKRGGLKSLATVLGVLSDKTIKANELQIKKDQAEQHKILNTTEIMNDNFESAMMEAVSKPRVDYKDLIEEDSLQEVPVS